MDGKILPIPQNGPTAQMMNVIADVFRMKYNCSPLLFARAPGRVNVIGEHIDYCGYAVLPMSIDLDIVIAAVKRDDFKLCISNTDSQYKSFECDINSIMIGDIEFDWFKYILCGIQGVKEEIKPAKPLIGLSLVVSGTIPPSSGLSSSSALVCAAALLVTYVNSVKLTLRELAEMCARAERYIGTEGGGMDQAASLLSKPGSAQLIQFHPLRCTPVSLPQGAVFVVANSLAQKSKATGSEYNTRVVECRLACRLIAKRMNVPVVKQMQLGELQEIVGKSFSEMVQMVKESMHPQPYSKQELCQILDMSTSQLNKVILSANTTHLTEFDPYKRALHVFTESSRVWEFKQICDDWKCRQHSASEDEKLKIFQHLGQLMDESHASAQKLYECSHPQLDKLVQLSKGLSYGARLTGAGWGGCIIALVEQTQVEKYKNFLKKEYYEKEGLDISNWSSIVFSSEPGSEAIIYTTESQ